MNSSNILGSILFPRRGSGALYGAPHFTGVEIDARMRESISRRRANGPRAAGWSHQEAWLAAPTLIPTDQSPERQGLGSTGPDPREGVPFKGMVQRSVVFKTRLPPSISAAAWDPIRMLLAMPLRPANPCVRKSQLGVSPAGGAFRSTCPRFLEYLPSRATQIEAPSRPFDVPCSTRNGLATLPSFRGGSALKIEHPRCSSRQAMLASTSAACVWTLTLLNA